MKELLAKRKGLLDDMRAILDANPDGLNAEAMEKYNKMEADLDAMDAKIDKERELAAKMDALKAETDPVIDMAAPAHKEATIDAMSSFETLLRGGVSALTAEQAKLLNVGAAIGDAASGGEYLVPREFQRKIVELAMNSVTMRSLATVVTTGGDRDIPVEDTAGSAGWVDELGTVPEDSPTFSQKTLKAWKLARIVKVSNEKMADEQTNLLGYLATRFNKAFSEAEEAGFITGDGTKKPTGLFTAATVGKTTAAANAITGDELIDLEESIKEYYQMRGTWIMKNTTLALIRKLKDSTGQYMYQASLRESEPDMLLGRPVRRTYAAPEVAASTKVIAFGDMSAYQIADRGAMTIKRLNEKYADVDATGFLGTKRVDGLLVNAEAVALLQMSA